MTWFRTLPLELEAKQWPQVGLPELLEFLPPDRVIVAEDGTVYVLASSGHPQRLEDGWWAVRYVDGTIGVAAGRVPAGWEEIPKPVG